jgi:Chaperone of endosialidase
MAAEIRVDRITSRAGINTLSFTGSGFSFEPNLTVYGDGYFVGIITAQDFNSLSDINYKENINTVNDALSKVTELRGVRFDWKESGLPSYGVIAQELQEVLPELVHGNDPKTVNYNGIIGVLIEAIKELKAEIEELKKA